MRVLHFLDSVGRGGAEMQALDLCRNAKEFGLDITLATANGGALENEFRASGVDFIKLNRKFPIDLYLASALRKTIRDRKIDIVHGYQAVDGMHLYLATRGLKKVKRVLSFQGGMSPNWKTRRSIKFLIPRMDANIVVSEGLKKWHEEIDGFETQSFRVIHNGADPKRLRPTGKSLLKELGLPDETLLIGMIGNFYRDPRKDQLTVCKALPKVFSEIKGAQCVFAGRIEAGAESKYQQCVNFCLDNAISERVHFLGARNDVPDIFAALDLFVFSSLQEGLPVAVSEAMLSKVPMIVSDIAPLLEACGNGEFAEVFPAKNSEILSEKILKLLKDKALRQDLAGRASRFAEEKFSIEAHLAHLKELYQSLLKN